jgi:RNA recognition motif-containing protein
MNEENSLWMGDISPDMEESKILASFQQFNIYPTYIKFIKDKKTNTNKNYCFVFFRNNEETSKALTLLNGKAIPNSNICFKLNKASYHSPINRTIYVGNLNKTINDEMLHNFFHMKYSSVSKATVIKEKNVSKGYGFVVFKKENEYKKCLFEMNGVLFLGKNIIVKEQKRKDENENSNKSGNNNSNSININFNDNRNNINNNYNINISLNNNKMLLSNLLNNSNINKDMLKNYIFGNNNNNELNILNNLNMSNNSKIQNNSNDMQNIINNINSIFNDNNKNFNVNLNKNIFNQNNNIYNYVNAENKNNNLFNKDEKDSRFMNNNIFDFIRKGNNIQEKNNIELSKILSLNDNQIKNNILVNKSLNMNINKNYDINNNSLNYISIDNKKSILPNNQLINNNINKNINNINNLKSDKNISNNNVRKKNYGKKNPIKLEILEDFDDKTLIKKIRENINKTFHEFEKLAISNGSNIKSK